VTSFAFNARQPRPFLTKVEHFFLVSNDAERLYSLFKDEFRLPVVWAYRSFGDFASGGLTLGNVVIEFVAEQDTGKGVAATEFKGIAFEPAGDADAAAAELKRRNIRHGDLAPFKYSVGGQERIGWINIDLEGFPPAGALVFICDYQDRALVAEGRRRASAELATQGGGPLGVTSLKEIVVGVKSVVEASQIWGKLLDSPEMGADAVFTLGSGPRIRLVQADAEGIQSIAVGVRSEGRAKLFLTERGMLGGEGGRLRISPSTVRGLNITLAEN
jgi:hypothetical protein